jgi:hypothetical protein
MVRSFILQLAVAAHVGVVALLPPSSPKKANARGRGEEEAMKEDGRPAGGGAQAAAARPTPLAPLPPTMSV